MLITADLRDRALHVAGTLDPEAMSGVQAAEALEELAVADKALGNTVLFLALRVARTDAWRGQGHKSPADWLAAKAGISVAEAARQLGTAKKADRLPKTKKAMKGGNLSPDQAGAVTDGADADPEAEDSLLDAAAHDTNQALRDKAAKAKAAATGSAARERRIRANRSLRRGTDAEGAGWLRLYGPGASMAGLEALLKPFEEHLFRHGRQGGERDSYENRSFDAFFAMVEFLRSGGAATPADGASAEGGAERAPETGDDSGPADTDPIVPAGPVDERDPAGPFHDGASPPSPLPDEPPRSGSPARRADRSGSPPQAPKPPGARPPTWAPPWDPDRVIPLPAKLPGGNNVKVIVLVDHTALMRGHTVAGETCEIAGLGPISVETAREILRDDPFLAVVVKRGRDVVNVAHHGRGLNAHQRTAIEAVGIRCTNIACNRTVAIQIDHRIPYATDPITELANQDPLCPEDHRLKTHHGHELEPGTGRRRFLPPDHPDHSRSRSHPAQPGASVPDPTRAALSAAADVWADGDPRPSPRPGIDRPATLQEEAELEARVLGRLAERGIHIAPSKLLADALRAEQPSLC